MGTVPASAALDLASRGLASSERDAGAQRARAPPAAEFHCTAFGRFHNVAHNPTEELLRSLPDFLHASPLPTACALASATVLETAAAPSRATLERMYDKLTPRTSVEPAEAASPASPLLPPLVPAQDVLPAIFVAGRPVAVAPPPVASSGNASVQRPQQRQPRVVFIHFGLNVTIKQFHLELQARNEATFSCPDEAGWSPVKCRIDPDASVPLDHVRQTSLPVHRLVADLRATGFDVAVSKDAGRFVCNWVYYNSLRLADAKDAHSLFVHVPPLTAQPIETHQRFFSALLQAISALYM